MSTLVMELHKGVTPDPEKNVFSNIWEEYERVILQSLVTSFGLDFLVQDQHGGDVDTIHNVRQIGKDADMKYKNMQNQVDYANRGDYDSSVYHKDPRYIAINNKVSKKKKDGKLIDAYTGVQVARNAKIDLDHTIAAKEIHDDPGRVLAGLAGTDLANCEENLNPTNRSINRSMQQNDMDDYLFTWTMKAPERRKRIAILKSKTSLTDKERKELEKLEQLEKIDSDKMQKANQKARKAYEAKLQKAYYTSPKFLRDTASAASKRGMEMGARQALGFLFVEVWISAKEELQAVPAQSELADMLNAVGRGIEKGVNNAKIKYKMLLSKFGEGFVSGVLASFTTTICNIFFTTAKNLVRNIRQIYASVVQAGKILLFNPDDLILGDRIKATTVVLATGASVLVGTAVGEIIGKTPLGMMPEIGPIVVTFCSTLVSGLLSCTLLVCLDRSKFINMVIDQLNKIPSEVNNFREVADMLEELAAQYMNLDIEKFKQETQRYSKLAVQIDAVNDEQEMSRVLQSAYQTLGIQIPWEGDFDSFMKDKTKRLAFC